MLIWQNKTEETGRETCSNATSSSVGLKFKLLRFKCYTVPKEEEDMKLRTELNKPHESLKPITLHSLDT
jgi:hypothetical protein